MALLVALLLFSGCTAKLPVTRPLNGEQEREARVLLEQIGQQGCPDFLDADATISWQGFGRTHSFNATLQATRSGMSRLSGLDPLGRSFFILVTDGITFTLVDNQKGRGYTGSVDSTFIQQYVPTGLSLTMYFPFLAAQLPDQEENLLRLAWAEANNTYWITFAQEGGMNRHVEVEPESGRLNRQLLVDREKNVVLDVQYDGYLQPSDICSFPAHFSAVGSDWSGTVQVALNKVYEETMLPEEIFHLQIPGHFVVNEID